MLKKMFRVVLFEFWFVGCGASLLLASIMNIVIVCVTSIISFVQKLNNSFEDLICYENDFISSFNRK